jgi:hypothetical protein
VLQDDVEDTKGEKEEKGALQITTLRMIWTSKRNKRTSICIGYNCVTALNVRTDLSRLKGTAVCCCVASVHCSTEPLAWCRPPAALRPHPLQPAAL